MRHFKRFPGVVILGVQWPGKRHLVFSVWWTRGDLHVGLSFNLGLHPAERSPHATTKILRDARQTLDRLLDDRAAPQHDGEP